MADKDIRIDIKKGYTPPDPPAKPVRTPEAPKQPLREQSKNK